MINPTCPYCDAVSDLCTGANIYPHRKDLHSKFFYLCQPCNAYVGCHPGTTAPLGRLANKQLRNLKKRAHAAFDPIWRVTSYKDNIPKGQARRAAYAWLAKEMNLIESECHIGMMDETQCQQVVNICNKARRNFKG